MKVTQSYPALCDPWTVAHQAPLSMEFSRQEYWSRQLIPSLGDLPNPGIEPRSGLWHCRRILYQLGHQGSPAHLLNKLLAQLCLSKILFLF